MYRKNTIHTGLSYPSISTNSVSQSTLKTISAKDISSFSPLPSNCTICLTSLSPPSPPGLVPIILSVFPDLVLSPILPQFLKLCHCALRTLFIDGTADFYYSPLNSLLKPNLLFPPQKKMTCQKSAVSSMLFNQWSTLL